MLHRIILQGFTLAFLVAATPATLRAQDPAADVVEVIFTTDMDKAELATIQDEMKTKGIELTYVSMDYSGPYLTHIAFSIATKAGAGKADGDVKPDQRFGFRYDPRPGAKVPFMVGTLDAPPAGEGK